MNFIKKIYFGLRYGTLFYNEGAFQCPNLELTQCEACKECNGTGVIKMGFYSFKVAYGMEKYGYKLIWSKWNPLYNESE